MKIDIYEPCDRAIKSMNRELVKSFGQMKTAKWDQVHIIQTVAGVYRKARRIAREAYYDVGFEAYLLAMALCGEQPMKAHKMAENAITGEWVEMILTEPDMLTHYIFDSELERKAYRLAEALEVVPGKNAEIDKAMKDLSRQLGQYAINVTDYAVIQAFRDLGIEEVEWQTEKDGRVCGECRDRDGETFRIDKVPAKPHWGCRCRLVPSEGFSSES